MKTYIIQEQLASPSRNGATRTGVMIHLLDGNYSQIVTAYRTQYISVGQVIEQFRKDYNLKKTDKVIELQSVDIDGVQWKHLIKVAKNHNTDIL